MQSMFPTDGRPPVSKQVSRRSFLKGAGVAAAGAVAATSLAGCGNGKITNEVIKDERTQSASAPDWLGQAPTIAEKDITETLNYDVVVVGSRTGGLPAIISAAENGAKVLGIDQLSAVAAPREDIGAIDSKLQIEGVKDFPNMAIDKYEAMEDIVRYANSFVSYDLIKLWADESGALVDWLTGIITRNGKWYMSWEGSIGTPSNARDRAWATGHSPHLVDSTDKTTTFGTELRDYAQEKGAEFRWSTTMVKCEQDSTGRVTGVIARDDNDQHYIRIKASKGVILSTGGYAANTEMLEARQPWNQRNRVNVPVGGACTGDGIKAALWCGGHMDPVGAACMFNRACVKPDEYAGSDVKGQWFWFGEQPFLKINLKGKRFCNESGPYDYMIHAAHMQPHHTYVDIWDSNYFDDVKQMNEVGCCRLYPFDNGAASNMPIQAMPAMLQGLEDKGYIQRADTMEELAAKLNLPVEQTVATWKHYNEMAAAGKDTDYNKEAYRLIALDKPPYFGVRTGAWYLASLDGVQIDTNMHPIDDEGEPIKGLYLTGNDSGGMFAISYPNLFTGLACGRTMTFGRRAGMLAATGQA